MSPLASRKNTPPLLCFSPVVTHKVWTSTSPKVSKLITNTCMTNLLLIITFVSTDQICHELHYKNHFTYKYNCFLSHIHITRTLMSYHPSCLTFLFVQFRCFFFISLFLTVINLFLSPSYSYYLFILTFFSSISALRLP